MMSTQANPLEMHERLHTVENPFYGERDYTFTFEFCAVEPIWQTHPVDYVSSNLAKPNIWMGESRQDHYLIRREPEAQDERVFSERECRSFALFCRDSQLHLVLTVWGEDADGKRLPKSRYDQRFATIATRQVAGKGDLLRLAHEQLCVIKLETRSGVSSLKVWNTREREQEPFTLNVPGESFEDFFSGFTEFQFNAVPVALRTGKHSLKVQRVATWRGNAGPEGEKNFRDYLEEKQATLKSFGYRQLPLDRLAAHYPLHKDRWSLLENQAFCSLKNADFEWQDPHGLCFDLHRNACSIALKPTTGRGACANVLLSVLPGTASLAGITTLGAQVDAWARSEPAFTTRNHRLRFRTIFADVQASDASQPFSLSSHYTDGTLAAIQRGALPAGLDRFMAQLKRSTFTDRSSLQNTMTLLQTALNQDKALNDERREAMGVLTLKTSNPEASIVFRVQICRRMVTEPESGALRYEENVVFQDSEGQDRGAFELTERTGFLLLSLSDDRKVLDLFFACPSSALPASLVASFSHSLVEAQGATSAQVIDEAVLELGVEGSTAQGTRIALSGLSLWDTALWQREGLITEDEQPDRDYNVKTLAYLGFCGLFEALLERYRQSAKGGAVYVESDV